MVDIQHRTSQPIWEDFVRDRWRDHWELYLVEGILLILLGIGAVAIPVFAGVAVAIFLGWLFLIGGMAGAVTTLMSRHAPGFWWSLISSIVTVIAGLLLVGWPFVGVVSLTLVLAAYLATDGMVSILFAMEHSRQLSRHWGLLLINGILDLVLAGAMIWMMPAAAFWMLGLFIGVDFVFGGASLIAMALAAKQNR